MDVHDTPTASCMCSCCLLSRGLCKAVRGKMLLATCLGQHCAGSPCSSALPPCDIPPQALSKHSSSYATAHWPPTAPSCPSAQQLRDREGIEADLQERLLGAKRTDLSSLLGSGPAPPPAFGALMFTDIARGAELYGGRAGVESGLVGQFLPVPLAGMFCSGERTGGWLRQASVV